MIDIPDNITTEHIIKAIQRVDEEGIPKYGQSSMYDLVYKDKRYPPKLVVSWANKFANGAELDRSQFYGGKNTPVLKLLERLGFSVIDKSGETVEYFTQHDVDVLITRGKQRWDKNDPEKARDFATLKGAYLKTEYWMKAVAKEAFGEPYTKIRKNPLNQAQKFEVYNWAQIYPSQQSKDRGDLAYTVGIDADRGFVIKVDTIGSQKNRAAYEDYLTKHNIVLDIPFTEGLSFEWPELIERSVEFIKSIEPHYEVIEQLLLGGQSAAAASSSIGKSMDSSHSLNQILYGPPGTGKTFNTIDKALSILDAQFLEDFSTERLKLKERFDELTNQGRIHFVTFHQSFSYEDFVEGIKASSSGEGISYSVESGVFKKACEAANRKEGQLGIDEVLNRFIEDISEQPMELKTPRGKPFTVSYRGSNTTITCVPHSSEEKRDLPASIEHIKQVLRGVRPDNIYCESYVNGIANYIRSQLGTTEPSFYPGQMFNAYRVSYVSDEIVELIKPKGNVLPFPMAVLNDLKRLVVDKQITVEDIGNKGWQRVETTIEPYLVNGYGNLVQQLVQHLLSGDGLGALNKSEGQPIVLIIDEINRGNISSIFGELITLVEPSKRAGAEEALSVTLPYSKEQFEVPNNLYLIGTMNTADRSLALMDTALRRRFDFVEMMPQVERLEGLNIEGIDVPKMLATMNKRIEVLYDREHTLGHAFFMPLVDMADVDKPFELLQSIFANKILPLLEEYFFEDWKKIRLVLGDNQKKEPEDQFITENGDGFDSAELFGSDADLDFTIEETKTYSRNDKALERASSYIAIYER